MSLGELVAGPLLGKALAELLKAILEAKQKNSSFQPALARLESTLKPIIPRLDQINRLNKKLSIQQSEMEELVAIIDKGKALVVKCRKVSTFNVAKKAKYSKELLALDFSIERYFNIILPLDHFKDTKEILVEVKKLSFFFLLGAAALIGFHLINDFHFKKQPFLAFQKDEEVAKGTFEMSFQLTGKVFMKIRAYLGARNIWRN